MIVRLLIQQQSPPLLLHPSGPLHQGPLLPLPINAIRAIFLTSPDPFFLVSCCIRSSSCRLWTFREDRLNRCRMVGRPWGQLHGLSMVAMLVSTRCISFVDKAVPIMMDMRQAREANIATTRDRRHTSPGNSSNSAINSCTSGLFVWVLGVGVERGWGAYLAHQTLYPWNTGWLIASACILVRSRP